MCHDTGAMDTNNAHSPAPPVVGLTGGIAAGKTTVSARLAELGAHVIDADTVGHQVLEPGAEAYDEVVGAFGREILDGAGRIVRSLLGKLIFADPQKREALNAISHPHMARRMGREIEGVKAREAPSPLIVVDAAILFEAGWDALCDRVWTVSVAPEIAVGRLVEHNGLTPEQARERLAAQWGNTRREARAEQVIRNEGSVEALRAQVDRLWADRG